ncbi:ABC transporter permease [Actinomycetes bacterium KLBMP 9797]
MTTAVARLTMVEARLFVRDLAAIIMGLLFPALLLLVLGMAMPDFRVPDDDLGGLRPVDIYLPVMLAMAIATMGLSVLPGFLSTYRERGVLRRLATTPVRPANLLTAQLAVQGVAAVTASALAMVVGLALFGVEPPARPASLLLALVLGIAAVFAVGLVIAAVAPTARAANGIGMLVYFPMLFFAGVWTPGPVMPETLRRISDFTPLGAASQALQDAWAGDFPSLLHLMVLLAYLLAGSFLAARFFRWTS